MDFEYDDTQRSIADLAASVLARTGGPGLGSGGSGGTGRSDLGQGGYDEAAWKALREAGLLSLPVPERLGGDGLGLAAPATRARRDGDRLLVDGVKVGVTYAAAAYRILVPVSAGTGAALAVVDPNGPGVTLTPGHSSGDAPEFTVRFDSAPGEALGGSQAVEDLHRCALAGACAAADGTLAGMLGLTSDHLAKREQFGRPLATFQAVAQQIADVYLAAQTLHLATWSACWRLGAGLDADSDIGIASYWLAEYGPVTAQTCHHLHGGLGVDITYPMHRYSSYLKDLARFVGGAGQRLDQVGEAACS